MRIHVPLVLATAVAVALSGCRGRDENAKSEAESPRPLPPAMGALRQTMQTQMVTLLRSIADAQERAHVDRGRYLDWTELRRAYYPDPIPPNLQVRMVLLGDQAYEAEVTHTPSGLRCGLKKGTTGGIYGAPRCR